MYYILNSSNRAEGPYSAEWIRKHARPDTLVSRDQSWIRYAEHPDFSPMAATGNCSQCNGPLASRLRYCPRCGQAAPASSAASSFPIQSSFQHPLDVAAIQILSHTPGLDLLAKFISSALIERLMNIRLVGHSVRVGPNQYPQIYRLYLKAARRLKLTRLPDLYVSQGGDNAFSVGIDKYYVVVETGLLMNLEEDELQAVLAHELGHVKCEHMKYLTIVSLLQQFGQTLLDMISLPLAPAFLLGVQAALMQWYQKSELSADRAALLVTQDVLVVQRMLSKLAGYSPRYCDSLNIDSLKDQATQFDEIGSGSLVEKALKVWTLLQLTHPVPVLRIREIGEWATCPEYPKFAGEYADGAEALPACAQCGNPAAEEVLVFCGYCGERKP